MAPLPICAPVDVTVGADLSTVFDRDAGAEEDIRFDGHVAANDGVMAQPYRLRGCHRDAIGHHAGAGAPLPDGFRRRELIAGVDAEHFIFGTHCDRGFETARAAKLHRVGQIIFALGILVADVRQQLCKTIDAKCHHARVAQPHALLIGTGLFLLPDRNECARGISQQPAVACGIGGFESEHRDAGPGVEQSAQSLQRAGLEQRRIGVKYHHVAVVVRDGIARGQHGIGGTELVLLNEHARARSEFGSFRANVVHSRPDHHGDIGGLGRASESQNMAQHGTAGDFVQHLGHGRLHARAFARSKDDDE